MQNLNRDVWSEKKLKYIFCVSSQCSTKALQKVFETEASEQTLVNVKNTQRKKHCNQ